MSVLFSTEEFAKLKDYLVLYRCALKNMQMRVDTMQEDFNNLQTYNPIEHVKTRLKSPESIAEKLHRRNLELTAESAHKNLTDVAGLRCICSYAQDIEAIADVFKRQPDLKLLEEKNYVKNPKVSGYRSHHLILEVSVHMTKNTVNLPVEVQIRTQAMDFWATLEHKVRYKYENGEIPEHLVWDLQECATQIAALDHRMWSIQDVVQVAYTEPNGEA